MTGNTLNARLGVYLPNGDNFGAVESTFCCVRCARKAGPDGMTDRADRLVCEDSGFNDVSDVIRWITRNGDTCGCGGWIIGVG